MFRIMGFLAVYCAAVALQPALAAAEKADTTSEIETVVVTAHPLSAEGLALASESLSGEELSRRLAGSIGETVGYEPGVHAAGFGQAASRPVIHGLSGPRVRTMEDRIDSLDVSVTSADHATSVEPFLADGIEILKGPSTLLYGSGAIGGVVDAHTGRIPHAQAETPISGRLEARVADNADRKTLVGRLDGGSGGLAWHVDGFRRDADDYEIPGYAESRRLREQEAAEAAAASESANESVRDELPGSDLEVQGGALGLSLVGERGFIGAAVSRYDADYGLPGGHAHVEEGGAGEEGNPSLDLNQTRIDFEAGLDDPFEGFESVNVRVASNDYRHREIEPDGAVATVFDNDAIEARVEFTHLPLAGWRGTFGVQYTDRDFSALGEEAFIAPVDTRSLGAFWVVEQSFAAFDIESGLRFGGVSVDSSNGASEDFSESAASLGLIWPFADAWSLGLLMDYSVRAPVAEELYSDGPHLTTNAFEIGDPELDEEKALSFSANLRYATEDWFFSSTLYYIDFSDYVYEAPTGAEIEALPVFVYRQTDAEYLGLDVEIRRTVASWEGGSLELGAQFDTVSASLDVSGNDDVARLPPTRYGVSASARWGIVRASVDYLWVEAQQDVADFELPSDSYEDLRAYLGADLSAGGVAFTVFLQGRNLTDDEQRQHSSFIKDSAPQPGRTLEAGIRASF
ncbi:MAG: TonB-dependent receptor [Pseudomonadales bacterium]|nr:TonB-dependent receptor [Pseudomonadales bacterium]